jgi:hypothetical protein
MRVPITGGLPQMVLSAFRFSEWGLCFECPHQPGFPCVLAQRQGNRIVFRGFDPFKGFLSKQEIARLDFDAGHPVSWSIAGVWPIS